MTETLIFNDEKLSQFDISGTDVEGLKPVDVVLESKVIDLEQLLKDPNYEEVKYDKAIYLGIIIKNKRTGPGVIKYESGRQYEGDWLNNQRHGKGYERYPNGNSYLGDF